MFCMYTCYAVKDCTDGTSNTILFAESLVGEPTTSRATFSHNRNNGVTQCKACGNGMMVDASAMPWATSVLPAIAVCTNAFQAATLNGGNIGVSGGVRWGYGGVGITMMNTVITPNSKIAQWNTCSPPNGGGNNDYAIFSNCQSNHPGGANVLFADGSTRFIKDTIQQQTWFALGTRSHGDVLSNDQF
jgi:prepilin-type processing-associated H-X9-DG protein